MVIILGKHELVVKVNAIKKLVRFLRGHLSSPAVVVLLLLGISLTEGSLRHSRRHESRVLGLSLALDLEHLSRFFLLVSAGRRLDVLVLVVRDVNVLDCRRRRDTIVRFRVGRLGPKRRDCRC